MRTMLRLGCMLASLSFVGFASATDVTVSANVTADCQINAGTSGLIDLTGQAIGTPVPGTFKYQCNFAGPNVLLRFTSTNGGIKNGSSLADYGIFLNDQTPAAVNPTPANWLHAANATGGGVVFPNISVPLSANTERSPYFYIALLQPTPVAGMYSDTLTIEIIP